MSWGYGMASERWEENLPCPACNMRGCPYCDDTGRVDHIRYSGYGEIQRVIRSVGKDDVVKAVQAEGAGEPGAQSGN